MGRRPCCSKEGLKKGAWTALEDKILSHYINIHGEGKWRNLPKRAGLKRCGKSCRLRWLNYLRPDIKRGNISHDEEELIIRLHNLLGNRWSLIAGRLPGRTDNEIKNYWNTNLAKKIQQSESSSTTCRIPSNPIRKEAKHIKSSKSFNQLQSPKLANTTSSSVVRTKATRCTKVVNLQDQLEKNINNIEHDHDPIIFGTESKEANSIVNDEPKLGLMVSDYNHENTNGYSEFSTMMNFESDDQEDFLSKFLDMDFLHFYSGIEGQSSPKSHDQDQSQPPLFNEDHNLYGEDLPSAPLIESGLLLDWLQD